MIPTRPVKSIGLDIKDFTVNEKPCTNISLLFYIIFVSPLCIALFLYGFFPLINYNNNVATADDIPKFIENVRVKPDVLYQPVVKKLVIMVIDALRWDFITGPIGKAAMPVTSSLIANSSACLLQAMVQPPTVTMPRIKAITTGTVPGFIDVALNFGSKPVAGDSVLLQARKYGHKLIFYGDETWLTLFPTIFEHYDGTTSFIVTDFTEVDNNVTRHVHRELHTADNWSIMILHYLGLDHIGHVIGPFSPLIKTKLKEMDDIIAEIQYKINQWNQKNDPSLFIICGDHGMKDTGGHGGSTIAETTVPFIAIGGECHQDFNNPTKIAQIDIASTLSVILGLPIPFSNLGTAFSDVLYGLPISRKLFILYYNSKQVFNHFQKLPDYDTQYAYEKYMQAIKLHVSWLNTKDPPKDIADDIALSYQTALREMKEMLISNMIKYDSYLITIAIFFLCQIICIMVGTQKHTPNITYRLLCLIVLSIILWISTNHLWESESMSLLYSKDFTAVIFIGIIIIVLLINNYLLANTNFFILKKSSSGITECVCWIAALLHAISLSSSSFIEEEHQTWYFYWATLLTILLYNSVTKLILQLQLSYKQCPKTEDCIKLLLMLIGHRVLRKLNSTGDKYGHLPDIAGWLKKEENQLYMSILLITALSLLIWISFTHEDTSYKRQSLVLNVAMSVFIYLRHMHNNNVVKLPLYPSSRETYEVQIFWILLLFCSISYIYRLPSAIKRNNNSFASTILFLILRIWITVSALIHQPHNVILLPLQIMFSSVIGIITKKDDSFDISTLIYSWSGNVFYFYQGNSNSLATIDVGAGYVGMQSYKPFINGTLLVINTYSAPVLAYLVLIYQTVLQFQHQSHAVIVDSSRMYLTWRLLPVTIYTIIISIQRYHLFVWTVFSPKLLYEAAHFVVISFVALITQMIIVLQGVIHSCDRNTTNRKDTTMYPYLQATDNTYITKSK